MRWPGKKVKFVDSWICGFEVFIKHINGNLLFVGNQILWFYLSMKTMKIGILSTVKVLKFMDTNFHGSGNKHKFKDSWICGLEVFSIHINGNLPFVWNQISWFCLPTKTMKIGFHVQYYFNRIRKMRYKNLINNWNHVASYSFKGQI